MTASAHRPPVARPGAPWAAAFLLAGPLLAATAFAGPPVARQALDALQVVPAVSSEATGWVEFELDPAGDALRYTLHYAGLEGAVSHAQLRFAQRNVNGGLVAWLCGTPAQPGPAGTPVCPAAPGRLQGVLEGHRLLGPVGQGVGPGRFPALVDALGLGLVYVDVRSERFEEGEIRGQVWLAPVAEDSLARR